MEIKNNRALMFKSPEEARDSYKVYLKIDDKDYVVPLYANIAKKDESIYYGGTVLVKSAHEEE